MSGHTLRAISAVTLLAAVTACSTANAERDAERERARSLAIGTTLRLATITDVTSQKDEAGKPFTARTTRAALNTNGDTVIPAGAVLAGTVTVLHSAASPGANGRLEVAFSTVRFDGQVYPIQTRVVSLATAVVGRGVTLDDAAKVGVGAAAGAVAGRVIGGNRTGTAVGAVAGGTAGVVYANRTKDHDIVLTPGSAIVVALTSPFSRPMAIR